MRLLLILVFALTLFSCETRRLPIYGNHEPTENGDTIFHSIGTFQFINQDSLTVSEEIFAGKIYVADFFFINCPEICPNMTAQMNRVYKKFEENPNVLLLSHSIDTRNDSVPALKSYAEKLGVPTKKWHFVTGERDQIYQLAKEKYYISTMEDANAEGGYLHNQKFILIDQKGRIRGYYTGTEKEDVDRLMVDMELLLESEE